MSGLKIVSDVCNLINKFGPHCTSAHATLLHDWENQIKSILARQAQKPHLLLFPNIS